MFQTSDAEYVTQMDGQSDRSRFVDVSRTYLNMLNVEGKVCASVNRPAFVTNAVKTCTYPLQVKLLSRIVPLRARTSIRFSPLTARIHWLH